MQFRYHDLGQLQRGQIVKVNLSGTECNVRLMDSSNFSSYKRGRSHRCYGGHSKRAPVRFTIPHSGHWYVTVDLGGGSGRIGSSVEVMPGHLRPIQQPPLSSLPSLVHEPSLLRGEEDEADGY